jgi:hypothetical protein|tara:strand:- start:253 stop:657 length:405 start_codon:yes stop_codon:yes gene_type:complete
MQTMFGRKKEARRAKFPADGWTARELQLYIENDNDLYQRQFIPIVRNLMRKRAAGKFDMRKSIKLYGYLVESGAKKYAKEFGDGRDWSRMFNPRERQLVATRIARNFKDEADLGNYDNFLPKYALKNRSFKARR